VDADRRAEALRPGKAASAVEGAADRDADLLAALPLGVRAAAVAAGMPAANGIADSASLVLRPIVPVSLR